MSLMTIALNEIGTAEIVGKEDNPEVLKYFNETGYDGKSLKDETSWCSAFVGWALTKAGYNGTVKLNARSWLAVGEVVTEPKLFDVVIFWREERNSWKGHVAFYISSKNGFVYCLGGNQSNKVSITAYPKGRVLGYRRINNLND
jgi:uncharacterized protein (TIGR02594 family)